jgi:hypothetical protein
VTWTARTEKRTIWTAAPAAYQKGPAIPYRHAMFDDCTRVATHVHWDTSTDAVNPDPISLLAVVKLSAVNLYLFPRSYRIVRNISDMVSKDRMAPAPHNIPHPISCDRIASPRRNEH